MSASTNWTELGGVAQIVAAGGTLILAGFTFWLAHRTHQLAEKAKVQADASLREAKATEALALESKADRLLLWRPQLEIRDLAMLGNNAGWSLRVRNSGAAPALDAYVAIRSMDNVNFWMFVGLGDLRPGDDVPVNSRPWQHGLSLTSIFANLVDMQNRFVVNAVVMCSDVLGRRLRFGVAEAKVPYPGELSKALPVEISTINDDHPNHDAWASEPLVWG